MASGQDGAYVILTNFAKKAKFDLHSQKEYAIILSTQCGSGSVGRAKPCQGLGREFESRLPLQLNVNRASMHSMSGFCMCLP